MPKLISFGESRLARAERKAREFAERAAMAMDVSASNPFIRKVIEIFIHAEHEQQREEQKRLTRSWRPMGVSDSNCSESKMPYRNRRGGK